MDEHASQTDTAAFADAEQPRLAADRVLAQDESEPGGKLSPFAEGSADFDFRYEATLGGYIFNLSTNGYATGTYNLNFTAGLDPATHSAPFAVK